MAMQGMVTRLTLEGCIMSAASTPSNAPCRAISALPQPCSSAGDRAERESRSHAGGGDQVVAAGVPHLGERVVFGEQRHAGGPVGSEFGREGRLEAVGAFPHLETGRAQGADEQRCRLALLEGELGIPVDRMGEAQQLLPHRVDGPTDLSLESCDVHGSILPAAWPAPCSLGSGS
jgi:hypothetical protein